MFLPQQKQTHPNRHRLGTHVRSNGSARRRSTICKELGLFFSLTRQLLQTFVEAQQQLIKFKDELDALKAKLASLEEEYGYVTPI